MHQRVVMLTSTLPRWKGDSTPRFVLDLASRLVSGSRSVDVLAPGFPRAARSELFDGVLVHRFSYMLPSGLQKLCYDGGILPNIKSHPTRIGLVPPFLLSAYVATRRLLATTKPEVVHAHWIVPMGLIGALAIPRNVPLVVTVHGTDVLALQGGAMDRLKAAVLARADHITCNGSPTAVATARLLRQEKPVTVIPMGAAEADPGVSHGVPLPTGRFKALFAGRLFRGKGLDDLLHALASFGDEERPFLLVAGTGPEAERFAAVAASLGIASDVNFLGGLEHQRLLALMRDVDAVLVPTRSMELIEAQGLVIAEAMLAGTAVIATTGGGAEDHVRHGKNGFLVQPGEPGEMAEALRQLMRDPAMASGLGKAGRDYARDNLTWAACARAFEGVYESATAD